MKSYLVIRKKDVKSLKKFEKGDLQISTMYSTDLLHRKLETGC